jgi:hypothetical protein
VLAARTRAEGRGGDVGVGPVDLRVALHMARSGQDRGCGRALLWLLISAVLCFVSA